MEVIKNELSQAASQTEVSVLYRTDDLVGKLDAYPRESLDILITCLRSAGETEVNDLTGWFQLIKHNMHIDKTATITKFWRDTDIDPSQFGPISAQFCEGNFELL